MWRNVMNLKNIVFCHDCWIEHGRIGAESVYRLAILRDKEYYQITKAHKSHPNHKTIVSSALVHWLVEQVLQLGWNQREELLALNKDSELPLFPAQESLDSLIEVRKNLIQAYNSVLESNKSKHELIAMQDKVQDRIEGYGKRIIEEIERQQREYLMEKDLSTVDTEYLETENYGFSEEIANRYIKLVLVGEDFLEVHTSFNLTVRMPHGQKLDALFNINSFSLPNVDAEGKLIIDLTKFPSIG
jgi:hypothetical protein